MNYEVFYIKLLSEEKGLVVGSIAYTVNGEVVFVEVRKNNDILDVLKDEFSSKKIYYTHNLFGDFFRIAGLIANNYKFSWLYTNSVLYGVDIMFPGKIIHLRCSFSLIPAPLFKFYTLVPFIKTSSYDTKALSRSHDYSVQKILNPKTLLTGSESLKLEVIDSTKLLYGGLLSF